MNIAPTTYQQQGLPFAISVFLVLITECDILRKNCRFSGYESSMSTEIDQRIEELNLQKQELEGKIAALDEQGAREAVLEGLRTASRHIFFRNNDNIVFDTQEQILWAVQTSNGDYTEQLYPGLQSLVSALKNAYSNDDQVEIAEIRGKIDSLVSTKERYGFKDWRIPHWGDYKQGLRIK